MSLNYNIFNNLRYNTYIISVDIKVTHLQKIVIFGNSGSGKSTLAKKLAADKKLAHLDLDTIAWLAASPPQRKSITDSAKEIAIFTQKHDNWVIEGCYSDLLELLIIGSQLDAIDNMGTCEANEVFFLDLPIDVCIKNAEQRPWEPHKYSSKKAQDENLHMLVNWIQDYDIRIDSFSKKAHQTLYESFEGKKTRIKHNK
jgi:adenylate kinase family enzyme